MTDFFIKTIPLPVDRPTAEINHQIALEASRKPAGELFDIWSYPTGPEGVNRISEAYNAFKGLLAKIGDYMNFSTYSGYGAEALQIAERNPWTTAGWLFVGS